MLQICYDAFISVFRPDIVVTTTYHVKTLRLITNCSLKYSRVQGGAHIITDGVDGFLIKNRDILAFADRVCQLIEDKELRLRMGQAAIKSAQRYRADVIMPKWKELFEHLCRKK